MITTDGPILMVDDEDGDILIAERCHRRSGLGNQFMALRGGRDLLDYLVRVRAGRAEWPALVLLDINMPEMGGFEVLANVRAESDFADVPPILMFSNSDHPQDAERANELGADGFRTKPCRVDDYVDFFKSLVA